MRTRHETVANKSLAGTATPLKFAKAPRHENTIFQVIERPEEPLIHPINNTRVPGSLT